MKKFLNWLKSPASDFALFIILLVLACIAGHNAHLRLDITSQRSYSLSEASKRTVSTLTEPLSVKVFFSENLPTTYSKVSTYVKDILIEYKGAANKNFSYTIFDMNKPENQKIASSYGLRQIQIQEVKNNDVQFKQVWMGVAISYGDSIEVIDSITNEAGFEYNLTTKIAKIISKTDALAGLQGNSITVTLYATDELKQFRINGFDQIDQAVQNAFNDVNKKNLNRLTYLRKNPTDHNEINELSEKYGIQTINWENKDKSEGLGIFGLIMEYGDKFRIIPLDIQRSIFGFVVTGMESLNENITNSIQGLLAKSTQVGYITGHEETKLQDEEGKKLHFVDLLSDMYELTEINLKEADIPANLSSIIINGPTTEYSEEELYKIDQFVMRGGNVMIFSDPYTAVSGGYYQPATYNPVENGLNNILSKYGIKLETNYVFDENCYVARQQGYGNINLWWAPQLPGKQLNQKNPITKNLGYVIFLQPGGIDTTGLKDFSDLKLTVLAKTSEKAWKESRNIQLNPGMECPYDKSIEKQENLAILVEGKFSSAFDKKPGEDNSSEKDAMSTSTHIAKARQSGKIFVAGTSYITSNQLIDERGNEPVAMMIRNVVDYMNGNSDLCTMRTKGVSFQSIGNTNGKFAHFVEWFCILGLAIIVAVIGLVFWQKRSAHRRKIHDTYNPNDKREIK